MVRIAHLATYKNLSAAKTAQKHRFQPAIRTYPLLKLSGNP